MKLTNKTGYYSPTGEVIHEGDGFIYLSETWIHMGKDYKPRKSFDPKKITGVVSYDNETQEWWVSSSRKDLNIMLKDIKGITQKGELYRPEH